MTFFMGSREDLPKIAFDRNAPAFNTRDLNEQEMEVKRHFSSLHVTYVGASSGCGCGFRKSTLYVNATEWVRPSEEDEQPEETQKNQKALHDFIISHIKEDVTEIYGCWYGEFDKPVLYKAEIRVEDIIDKKFFFKERGYYIVKLGGLITKKYSQYSN